MTLIIIEGHDCSGKSSLAGHVVDVLRRTYPTESVTYLHAGPPDQHPLDEYVAPLLDYRPGTGQHVVCDRWHVGESVYPAVLRRPTDMTSAVRTYVELFLLSRGAVLVHLDASERYLTDCGWARGDDERELNRIALTIRAFHRAVASSLLPRRLLDVERSIAGPQTALDLVSWATYHASRVEDLSPLTTYVGPPRPRLLLVGDRRGTPSHDLAEFGRWPAFVPRTGTSGRYLLETLTSEPLRVSTHGLTLGDVGLINACDVDDVALAYETLGRPFTVGLGRNAQRVLRGLDLPHQLSPHPQHQRRFKHHDRSDYLRALVSLPQAVTS